MGRVDAARRIMKQRQITVGHVATAACIVEKRVDAVGCVLKTGGVTKEGKCSDGRVLVARAVA